MHRKVGGQCAVDASCRGSLSAVRFRLFTFTTNALQRLPAVSILTGVSLSVLAAHRRHSLANGFRGVTRYVAMHDTGCALTPSQIDALVTHNHRLEGIREWWDSDLLGHHWPISAYDNSTRDAIG